MISKRRMKAYERAEEVCKAFRYVVSKRNCDIVQDDWDAVMDCLISWMDVSGKHKYDAPKRPRRYRVHS